MNLLKPTWRCLSFRVFFASQVAVLLLVAGHPAFGNSIRYSADNTIGSIGTGAVRCNDSRNEIAQGRNVLPDALGGILDGAASSHPALPNTLSLMPGQIQHFIRKPNMCPTDPTPSPVPEPSSALLLAIGLLGMAYIGRKNGWLGRASNS